jgi:homoserine kinase
VGGLIAGLYTKDYELIGRSLWRNCRTVLKRTLTLIKKTAYENGALGSGISGSGPSILHWVKEKKTAEKIAKAMSAIYDEWIYCMKFIKVNLMEYELFKNEYLVLMPVAKPRIKTNYLEPINNEIL